jgi:hypothetical protein
MNICWLGTHAARNPGRVGGKAANLSRLAARYPVPPGFCLTASSNDAHALPASVMGHVKHAYDCLGQRCGRQPSVPSFFCRSEMDGRLHRWTAWSF